MRNRRGSMTLETAMLIPVIVLLLVGMTQIAKFTYTYVELRKVVNSVASYLASQPGVDFCSATDSTVSNAKNFGLTGTTDNSLPVFINGLTTDMIEIVPESYDPQTGFTPLDCGGASGGVQPNFISVSIKGYTLQPRIPFLPIDAIPLQPQMKVPFGGV